MKRIVEKHECEQSERLVTIVEEQRATIERMRLAVEYHREDARELRGQIEAAEKKRRQEAPAL